MVSEAAGFGSDLGTDLVCCSVTVFEDVVLVVQLGEPCGQSQFMSVTLVNVAGEIPRGQLTGEHAACECSRSGSLTGLAGDQIEGKAEFAERFGKQLVHLVVRLGACAGGQDSQAGAVESGDERITGGTDDVARTDLAHTPEGSMVLKIACC